jgi:selenide, water dikinase
VHWDGAFTELQRLLLADAQTSGGLLIAVPRNRAAALIDELRAELTPIAEIIGDVITGTPGSITVSA